VSLLFAVLNQRIEVRQTVIYLAFAHLFGCLPRTIRARRRR
jgi:hypothetical protein